MYMYNKNLTTKSLKLVKTVTRTKITRILENTSYLHYIFPNKQLIVFSKALGNNQT